MVMRGFFKFRPIHNAAGELVTVMGIRPWWKWAELLPGFYYGGTRWFRAKVAPDGK